MRGGKYLAEDRGAFELEPVAGPSLALVERTEIARAPLYEVAATHDGQPAVDWLRVFMRRWNAEEV
jgi:hypothetical protein